MNITSTQKFARFADRLFHKVKLQPNTISMGLIIAALAAFEIFNFSSTKFALSNILGTQSSGGVAWSMILALAFCGMDLAGIARLLVLKDQSSERSGWYLLAAWVLTAAMNAGLTWWAVSLVVYNQPVEYTLIINPMTFVAVVPVLVAVMVWIIRVLIIGSLVTAFIEKFNPSNNRTKSAKQPLMGFQPDPTKAPPGYKPFQNPARAQRH